MLVPVLGISCLNIRKENLVIAESCSTAAADGGDNVDEDVIEFPEGKGSSDGASRVH